MVLPHRRASGGQAAPVTALASFPGRVPGRALAGPWVCDSAREGLRRVASGEITSRLPGERALQQEFGLAPVIIRKAVHPPNPGRGTRPHRTRLGHLRGEEER